MTSPPERPQPSYAATLHSLLLAEFPGVDEAAIAACIVEADGAVDMFGLDPDTLMATVGLIARQLIAQRSGDVVSKARLDSEPHRSRRLKGTGGVQPPAPRQAT
jgi:hypothetical protein